MPTPNRSAQLEEIMLNLIHVRDRMKQAQAVCPAVTAPRTMPVFRGDVERIQTAYDEIKKLWNKQRVPSNVQD